MTITLNVQKLELPDLETCEAIADILPLKYEQRKDYNEYRVEGGIVEALPSSMDLLELTRNCNITVEFYYDEILVKSL